MNKLLDIPILPVITKANNLQDVINHLNKLNTSLISKLNDVYKSNNDIIDEINSLKDRVTTLEEA